MQQSLPARLASTVQAAIEDWTQKGKTARLWSGDKALWTGADEDKWLGWLDIPERELEQRKALRRHRGRSQRQGLSRCRAARHGRVEPLPGSSFDHFWRAGGIPRPARARFHRPGAGARDRKGRRPRKALYIVSSKSGSTLEPNIFKQYFFEKAGHDGSRFIAITDPGSKMQKVAESDGLKGFVTVGHRSAAAIRRCPISAWRRARRWASTSQDFSSAP